MNILDAPTFKISDRKLLVARVHGALLLDPDCRYVVAGGWKSLSHDEYGNWEARQHFLKVSLSFPVDVDNTQTSPEPDCSCDTKSDTSPESLP